MFWLGKCAHIRTRLGAGIIWILEDPSRQLLQCLSLISNLVNSAVWMTRWAPARKQRSAKNKSAQATFGNPDYSYRQIPVSKGNGF